MPGPVMTATEVAKLLGVNRKTVYEAVARGDIPHRKFGRRILFSRAAVMGWLAAPGAGAAEQVGNYLMRGLALPARQKLAESSRRRHKTRKP